MPTPIKKTSSGIKRGSSGPSSPMSANGSVGITQEDLREFGGSYINSRNKNPRFQMMKGVLFILAVAIAAAGAGYAITNKSWKVTQGAGSEKYQAVFLQNGQVFFGKMRQNSGSDIVLDNVYYIQVVNEEVPATEDGGEPTVVQRPQLVKKGDEAYGPEDSIRINRSQVTVVEELRDDSDIMGQIRAREQAE